ncbi:MAG TPA: hypothetical protein VLZ76_01285 [Lysobacter sp.]|nr:hypothetical protein [Lysobacter sp.]
MSRIGWSVGASRLLCVVGLAALLAACGFGRDPDAQSGAEPGEDTSLMAKARNLAWGQLCKRSSACDDEESREAIKALGEVLQQLPKEARRQLAEADMDDADVARTDADDASQLSGAGLAGLMEMARSMLEASAAPQQSADASLDVDSSDAAPTDVIDPEVAGRELMARLDGIPVRTGALTPAELLSRIAPPPAED